MPLNRNERRHGRRLTALTRALALVLALGASAGAGAQTKTLELKTLEPGARRDDPKARALFEEVAKAYKSLSTYSDKGEFVVAMKIGGKIQKQVIPLKLTFVRPNKIDFDAGAIRIISDGKTLTTAVIPLKRFTTAPSPEKIGFDTFREGQMGAMLFGGPTGAPMFVLLNLLTATDPAAMISQLGGSFQAGPAPAPDPKTTAGPKTAGVALLIDLEKGQPDILLSIDPATKLLSSIEMKIDAEQLARGVPKGQDIAVEQFGWTAGAVATEIPKDRSFAYAAPKDFAKVESLIERPEQPADTKLGKPAPNFTLTVLDGPGKTKTMTKADLAGKVVVIDFWATWCEPCMAELPEIQKVIESYASSNKAVVIVAVSQDDDPSELSEVRKLIEKKLASKNLLLSAGSVGLIGLDPSKSVGGAFEIGGYPTLVILDGKGVVQSVHEGYDQNSSTPLHKSLAKEIETLLEGKSLVTPKPSAKDAPSKDGKPKE
jgi:thiol-disulfide isomerase/thioredoxin